MIAAGGFRIATLRWGAAAAGRQRVLLLHGFQDNAASFARLGPRLAEAGMHCVAMDLPGHGQSSSVGEPADLGIGTYCDAVVSVLDALDWTEPVFLVGHSMGAAVATMVAGAFPERVARLVQIDQLGPITRDVDDAPQHLRRGILNAHEVRGKRRKTYAALDAAVDARLRTLVAKPGDQELCRDSARLLVERATQPVQGGLEFTHDMRVGVASKSYLSEDAAIAFLQAIECPTLTVVADNGWPFGEAHIARRFGALRDARLLRLPGGHHLHLDAETAGGVADAVVEFLTCTPRSRL